MKHCDLTLPSAEENLACDEVLLDLCDEGDAGEVIRFWEPAQYFVVVGYGNKLATEVNVPFCQLNTIPVLRRCSGGGTVLQGPGCLNYSLILGLEAAGPLQSNATACTANEDTTSMPWLALDFDIWRCTKPVAPDVALRLARRITQASWLASLLEGGALRKVSVTITALLVLITGSVGLEPRGGRAR